MGLDLLEFTLAVEESFALFLPEADAVTLTTPRKVIDYLEHRLAPATSSQCLDQMAFYQVRRAGMQVLGKPRAAFTPQARWDELLDTKHQRRQWQLLGQGTRLPKWPRFTLWGSLPGYVRTVGETARHLATTCPSAVKGQVPTWTRAEITQVITRLMDRELGVKDFDLDDRFVQDLGLS